MTWATALKDFKAGRPDTARVSASTTSVQSLNIQSGVMMTRHLGRSLAVALLSVAGSSAWADPTSTGLQLWLRADDGVLNAAGTAAADGEAVAQWLDHSGNSRHLGQADSSARPLLQATGINGAATLAFDGSNDWLFGSSLPTLGSNNMTIFVVASGGNWGSAGGSEGALFADAGWTGAVLEREFGQFKYWSNYLQGKGAPESVSGGALPGAGFAATIFTVQRSVGSSVTLGMDGQTVATASSGGVVQAHTGGVLSVGAHNNLGAPTAYTAWNGGIAEVLVYDRALNANEFNAVGGWLEQRYGLDTNFQPVPEPGTLALWLVGLVGVGAAATRHGHRIEGATP
jgi:hypothetical protein